MKEIEINFEGVKKIKCQKGTAILEALKSGGIEANTCAAVYVNNKAQALSAPLTFNSTIRQIPIISKDGMQIYRNTLAFLLFKAAKKVLLDKKEIFMGHSLGHAYYFAVTRKIKLSQDEIDALRDEVDRLIKADLSISYEYMNFDDAIKYFTASGQKDTVQLLLQRSRWRIPVCECDGFSDLYTRPLLNRTSLLKAFDLMPYQHGFLLRLPAQNDITKLRPFEDSPKIFSIYSEYRKWGHIVGVYCVPQLNALVQNRTIRDFININEAYQNKKLADIALLIAEKKDKLKVILIAGPSSSGKTTTAKRLSIQLRMLGINPIAISLDDYYQHPSLAPKDENGQPDLECLEALDVPYLNKQILDLLNGSEITLPIFDFKTGTRRDGKTIKLNSNDVLLLEGIHGLNDALTSKIDHDTKFKIYVSALTQMNIDEHIRVSTTDNRLLRRLVRDYNFRGSSASKTLSMWEGVQKGAEKHIFKFQNTADAVFNSALDYEISVLRTYAEPLLRSVLPNTPEYAEALRLLTFIENFSGIPSTFVPSQSILREFIGDSEFKY
ncbi:MAG: nucleoside kinase [Termitinemataceae bacterium]|nr:MAG: nucleoside kinase [Termitinemataceae bacterium]